MAKKTPQIPGGAADQPLPGDIGQSAPVDNDLPNAVDVDAKFLRGPVLSKQGWVVPDEDWQKANRAAFDAHWAAKV